MAAVDWQHHRRWMYDRMVDEPRLSRWYRRRDALPDEALAWFRVAVGRHYRVGFGAMGLNYYRDGRDSVAAHADRELRHLDDTLVAILTLGAARPFLLRPQGGGRAIDLHPASGDLLVMGGTCQARWEHAVPKVAAGAGPRISASIRWARGAGGAEQEWAPPDRHVSAGDRSPPGAGPTSRRRRRPRPHRPRRRTRGSARSVPPGAMAVRRLAPLRRRAGASDRCRWWCYWFCPPTWRTGPAPR